jgi:hypothetical protein
MPKRRRGKRKRPVHEHFKLAFVQTHLHEFMVEEPSIIGGSSDLPTDLETRLNDIELKIKRLEGERVFTSGEPPRALDSYIDQHPEMLSVNAEMKQLIENGKIRVIT